MDPRQREAKEIHDIYDRGFLEGRETQAVQRQGPGGARSREEVEEMVPDGVDPEQWRRYIGWRMSDLGQARSERGKKARAQQQVAHTTGSRPMIVGYDEMVILISTSL